MVKGFLLLVCLVLFFYPSCAFFLQTPFPSELTALQAYADLSVQISGSTDKDRYRMDIAGEYLCITLPDEKWVYVITRENLVYIDGFSGTFGELYLKDAAGQIILGDQQFKSDMTDPLPFTLLSPYDFAFAYGTENYNVSFTSGAPPSLLIKVYDETWSPLEAYSVSGGLDEDYNLDKVFLGPPLDDTDSRSLTLCFSLNNGRMEAVQIPLDYLYDPDTPGVLDGKGNYPFGLSKIYIPDHDERHLYYTPDGFVLKENGTFLLYGEEAGEESIELDSEDEDEEFVITFDREGESYYKFNTRLKKLYKYAVWW